MAPVASSSFENDLERIEILAATPVTSTALLARNLNCIYEQAAAARFDDYDVASIAKVAPSVMYRLFDLRVGLRGTRAGITEVKMGRGSPWAVPLLWMLPQPVLMELVLTGETVPIEQLATYGFLNYLEDTPDAVRARALQLARKIVEGAPLSVKAAKASVLAAMDLGLDKGLIEAGRLHEVVYASQDAIEGPKAFSEKRKPNWEGK